MLSNNFQLEFYRNNYWFQGITLINKRYYEGKGLTFDDTSEFKDLWSEICDKIKDLSEEPCEMIDALKNELLLLDIRITKHSETKKKLLAA